MNNNYIRKHGENIRSNFLRIYDELKKTGNAQKHMRFLGIYDSTISWWRQGVTMPRISTVKKICNKLGVSIEDVATKQIDVKLKYTIDINFR